MAILAKLFSLGLLMAVSSCSLVLDSDELKAERAEDSTGDTADTVDSTDTADTADTADTTDSADTTDTADTTDSADTTATTDTTDTTDTTPMVTVSHTGQSGCTLDYKTVVGCPVTCPSTGGWPLTFRATNTTGTVRWDFAVTSGYRLSTTTASTAEATIKINVPDGCLPTMPISIGPATVTAHLTVGGGPKKEVASFQFSVRSASQCGDDIGACPEP